jgi:transposase
MRPLSTSQRDHILSLLDSGVSANKIHLTTHVAVSTICDLRNKHRSSLQKSLGGRPSKLTIPNIRHATRLITSGKVKTTAQVTRALRDITNQPLSTQTTRRRLKDTAGLKPVVVKKKPRLTPRQRKERLDFALAHQHWTVEDWKKVVWSDETKINRLGSDGRKWAWKRPGEGLSDRLVEGTLKFGGGSVMVWGCMMWEGTGYAVKIDGRMDGDLYIKILEDDLQASIDFYNKTTDDVIFQQDNDPKHTCKKAKTWFQDHSFTVLPWPPQSPDLNPIEHLWFYIKRRLGEYEEDPKGILELWERVEKEWAKIPASVCQNLIESMPSRVKAVLKAKGGYTKY